MFKNNVCHIAKQLLTVDESWRQKKQQPLGFYVDAPTPFQIQLSQVKYTHPPRVLPHGRRGGGERSQTI